MCTFCSTIVKRILKLFSIKTVLCAADIKIIKSAADETIKEREQLQLGVFNGDEIDTGVPSGDQILRLPSDPQQLLQMEMKILQMESLGTLVVGQFEEIMDENGIRIRRTQLRFLLVNLLVTKCAGTLKKLILCEHYIVPEIEYPCLQHIKCGKLTTAVVTSAPNLTHVECSEVSLETIRKLAPDVVTYFDAGIWSDAKSLANSMCHLVNLKKIRLRIGGESKDIDKLLSPFTSLQHIHLILDFNDSENVDQLFISIATHNTNVTELIVGQVNVSDDALLALTELKHLTRVEISTRGSGFSGPAIASYLATTSPAKLKHFKLSSDIMFPNFNAKHMREEVDKLKDSVGNAYTLSLVRLKSCDKSP